MSKMPFHGLNVLHAHYTVVKQIHQKLVKDTLKTKILSSAYVNTQKLPYKFVLYIWPRREIYCILIHAE
jgi:hypothetical protein